MIFHNLQSVCTAKTLQRFCIRMLLASLSSQQRSTHIVFDVFRKGPDHPSAVTEPPNRL